MKNYKIDPQLNEGSYVLGELDNCLVLLMDNAIIPWFVLVPQDAAEDLYNLENKDQISMLKGIKAVSQFAREMFDFKELKVGAVGNSINQLHLHVVAKGVKAVEESDVDYNKEGYPSYTPDDVNTIKNAMEMMLKDDFQRA